YARRIDPAAARLLADLVGNGLDRLDGELAKLATYVGGRGTIEPKDVEDAVGSTRMELIFKVTDAMTRRDPRGALELWDRVLANDRAAPYRAIGGLAWGLRRLVQAKRVASRGGDLSRIGMRDDGGVLSRQLA